MTSTEQAIEKAKKVKFVILDIHGILTDNTLYLTYEGVKSECFSLVDRIGCQALMAGGIDVSFLTSKVSRAMDLVGEVYGVPKKYRWGTGAKVAKVEEYKEESGLQNEEICYVGDEMIDLGVMERIGFPVAPSDGAKEATDVAVLITKAGGGKGVVRELAEFILKAQGKWEDVVEKISTGGLS